MTKTLSILCFPLISLAALLSSFPQIHYEIFNVINHALPSKLLWVTITNTANFLFLSCIFFILLHNKERLLTNAFICAILIHYTVKCSKSFFAVLRPEHTADLINPFTLGPALDMDNYAMPSGHTASAFMAAIFIARAYELHGWKLWAIFSYAILIGFSRIAIGAHWPGDVFAGAALGIIISLVCTHTKLDLKHKSFKYFNLAIYLVLIILAIFHQVDIHDPINIVNDGIIVTAGLIALVIWCIDVRFIAAKKIYNKNQQ
jgi:membrane-associated phospholipid phosphatase